MIFNHSPQLVEKVCFFKKVLICNPYPQTPFPGKGAERGAAALTPLGATPQARMLWLLAKSFARRKTSRASNTKHPILKKIYRFFYSLMAMIVKSLPFCFSYSALLFLASAISFFSSLRIDLSDLRPSTVYSPLAADIRASFTSGNLHSRVRLSNSPNSSPLPVNAPLSHHMHGTPIVFIFFVILASCTELAYNNSLTLVDKRSF